MKIGLGGVGGGGGGVFKVKISIWLIMVYHDNWPYQQLFSPPIHKLQFPSQFVSHHNQIAKQILAIPNPIKKKNTIRKEPFSTFTIITLKDKMGSVYF